MSDSRDAGDARGTLPIVAAPDASVAAERTGVVWGVLLAAGTSSRYGSRNKLLEPIEGEPLVRHAARSLVASTLDGVTIVVGYEVDRVRRAVADLDVEVRTNDAYETGQSTSVRVGVEAAADHDADAVLIALADMPGVAPESIDRLVAAYANGAGSVLAAACMGLRGNPVLFDARHFDSLGRVDGDVGGRQLLLETDDAAGVETGDPGVLRDVDRPGDLREFDRD